MEEKIGVYRNSDKRSRQLKQKVRVMEMSAKGTLFPYIWNLQELFCRFSRGRGVERGQLTNENFRNSALFQFT